MPEISIRRILTHPATLFVGCVILVVIGSVALWENNHDHFLDHDEFQISPDRIVINGVQEELADQLKSEIVSELASTDSDGKTASPNSLDTQLVGRVASFVESRPYVRQASIRKSTNELQINVHYRHPVGIVEFGSLLIAVDGEGVILDGRSYQSDSPDDFMRITVNQPNQKGMETWQVWPDPRIVMASQVCDELAPYWNELELFRVVTFWAPGREANGNDTIDVWTKYRDGGRIIWRNASSSGEVTVEQKINAIRQYIAENGALTEMGGNKILDVRSGQPVVREDLRTAEQLQFLKPENSNKRTALDSLQNLLRGELDR